MNAKRIIKDMFKYSVLTLMVIGFFTFINSFQTEAKTIKLSNNSEKSYVFTANDIDNEKEIDFQFKLKTKSKVKFSFRVIGENNLCGVFLEGDWMHSWDQWAQYAHQGLRTETEILNKGTRNITALADYRDYQNFVKKKIKIIIKYKILVRYTNKLKMNKKITLNVGNTRKLKVRPKPSKYKIDGDVIYGTTNSRVADVSYRGVVRTYSPGTCYVWAKTRNGKKVKCKVVVKRY